MTDMVLNFMNILLRGKQQKNCVGSITEVYDTNVERVYRRAMTL